MKTQHTKGEWKMEYPLLGDFIIHNDGLRIVSVHLIDDKLEEQEANAKLIAAAPDLLETLYEIQKQFNENGNMTGHLWSKCEQAIKKATK
jgi:hypothetical protein